MASKTNVEKEKINAGKAERGELHAVASTADADTVDFDQEQSASIMCRVGVLR